MIRRLYRRLREWTSRDDDQTFVGSMLDHSVNYAHGGAGGEIERELEQQWEQAADLAEAQRER